MTPAGNGQSVLFWLKCSLSGKAVLLILTTLIVLPINVEAEFYEWTDENGGVFYTDDLAKIPPQYRSRAGEVKPSNENPINQDEKKPNSLNTGDQAKGYREQGHSVAGAAKLDASNGRPEAWWRNEAHRLRQQIRDEQDNLSFINERERDCEEKQTHYASCQRANCADNYAATKLKSESLIKRLKKRLKEELPEEARKAGADVSFPKKETC